MGTYTLSELLQITYQYYRNRFTFRDRDVVKRIIIKQIRVIDLHDRPSDEPRVRNKYEIISKSYPQYRSYYTRRDRRGRERRFQRTIAHFYDIILEVDRLSINTKNWRGRVGSGKKWNSHPPQNQIKSLYQTTRNRFRQRANARGNTNQERREIYRKLVEKHKHGAKFLDVGDFNSRTKGINGDFCFRAAWSWYVNKHLFGRQYFGNVPSRITNPQAVCFAPKHFLNTIEVLMNAGVLKND